MRQERPWKLFFPRLRCPHCGAQMAGVYFWGRFHLPRRKGRKGQEREGLDREGKVLPSGAEDGDEV